MLVEISFTTKFPKDISGLKNVNFWNVLDLRWRELGIFFIYKSKPILASGATY